MVAPGFTRLSGLGPTADLLERNGSSSLSRVFMRAEIPLVLLHKKEAFIPYKHLLLALENAARELGDDLFGLHLGQLIGATGFTEWGRYAAAAPDLRGALIRGERCIAFFQSRSELSLTCRDGLAYWSYRLFEPYGIARNHHADHVIIPMIKFVRLYTGPSWIPSRVELQYSRPGTWRSIEEAFGTRVCFDAPTNAIVFDDKLLQNKRLPFPAPAAPTFAQLRALRLQVPPHSTAESTRALIKVRLVESMTDIRGIAGMMDMSPRHLQRHLANEGHSYREILESVRMETAINLLRGSDKSVSQIALEVGYNEISSFSRAFHRSVGCAPHNFRWLEKPEHIRRQNDSGG